MLSHQTLDTVADAYIPALIIAIVIALLTQPRHFHHLLPEMCKILLLAFLPYGVMFADAFFHIWHRHGLDYSTHTATAAACCWYLFWLHKSQRATGKLFQLRPLYWLWPISLIAYLYLMRYQHYHSWQDMLTTLTAIIPFFLIHHFATR